MKCNLLFLLMALPAYSAAANTPGFIRMSLHEAESRALAHSHRLKAANAELSASGFQHDSLFHQLLPKLSLQGNYQYLNEIPRVALGPSPAIPFGTNNVYSFGPVLTYSLFDGFSARRAYQASGLMEEARNHDRQATELQTLLAARAAYVAVQLGLEELRAIHDISKLAEAEWRDVELKHRAGAASRLELVTAERSVLGYRIQFEQRQADLAAALRDFLFLLGDASSDAELQRPGPPGTPGVQTVLEVDQLRDTLAEQSREFPEPSEKTDPEALSLLAQARSLQLAAQSQSARAYPNVQVQAAATYIRPDMPNPPKYWQESIAATISLPLFLGDNSRAQSAQLRAQAEAAGFQADQRHEDLRRESHKGADKIRSLKDQRQLAAQDVTQSEEQARLYYASYKAGKINLIDVQNANVQALQAKVNAARIDAQLITQIIQLKALSSKEGPL